MSPTLRVVSLVTSVSCGRYLILGSNFNYKKGPENKECHNVSVNGRLYDSAGRPSASVHKTAVEQTLALLWLFG